jgi:carbamoyl-phosphate synthase large subunit
VKSLNVLITAASRRVPLVQAFRAALADLRVAGSVIACDINPFSPAVHVADRAYEVPLASDPSYLDTIAAVCDEERVGLIVPTIDDELEAFGTAAARFERRGARVAVSPPGTSAICNDKWATCHVLAAHGVATAETWLPGELPAEPSLPLFVKPRYGRGSVGAFAARTRRELEFFLEYVDQPVVQRYLDGPEFTIDLLCDFDGRPVSIVPRARVVIRAGVIDRGCTVKDAALIDLALGCADAVPFAGPVNIQCRVSGGVPTVFEINPRFSGGIPLTIASGADFPRMLVRLALGEHVRPCIGEFRHDLWMTKFESALFLPADAGRALRVPGRVIEGAA